VGVLTVDYVKMDHQTGT